MNAETGFSQEGFDAVSRALERLYPGQEGIFYRTVIPYALGGKDPLDGIEVWKSEHGVPHWHYVTYGFTELYEKESDISQESGYGFELTFRLKRGAEEQPPAWPVNLLQNLARYVFSAGNGFGPGHHMSCNGPIALDTDTKLTALGFRVDPELGELDTPNGHMRFLQAVALTGDEMEAMMCWDGQRFLEELERCIPLCLTDLKRVSQMGQAAFSEAWKAGVERDGSSVGVLYLDEVEAQLEDGCGYLRLGAGRAPLLARMLRARVGKGRDLCLYGRDSTVRFRSGVRPVLAWEDGILTVTLDEAAMEELCTVLPFHAGKYPLSAVPLSIVLIPTRITDAEGHVLEVIE